MFHASRALSAGQAVRYHDEEYSRGDYYTKGEGKRVPSHWYGAGAHELQLVGAIDAKKFAALMHGQAPDGQQLTEAQTGTGKRRCGWDFTCSADKSVSIGALVYGDERLVQLHDAALAESLEVLEQHLETRQRQGKSGWRQERTGRMVAAVFRHESSRALDPQLHSHVVVANLTRRLDGEWRALDSRSMFRAQKLATAIYRARIARGLPELGYGAEVRKDGSVGIAGFKRQDLEAFSKRRGQILKYARENGTTTWRFGQEAAQTTRSKKERNVDRRALVAAWREEARGRGMDAQALRGVAGLERGDAKDVAREAVGWVLEHLSERRSILPVSDVERGALERGMGHVTLADVREALAERQDVMRAGGVLTTLRAIAEERAIGQLLVAGRGRGAVIARDFRGSLSAEQLRAAQHVLRTPDLVVGVEGKAGTGKTRTLSVVVDVGRSAGWTVRTFAPTTSAVKVLRKDGLQAETVARLLRSKRECAACEMWIVDEAGLLSRRAALALLEKAHAAGVKVVLVGDRMQHKAVEAGRPFEQLVDEGMKTARLTEIHRQRDPQLRKAVSEASEGRAVRAAQMFLQQGSVLEHQARPERLQAAVDRYMSLKGTALVVTVTNDDRRAVNKGIREARITLGQVEKQSYKAEVVVAKDLTRAQRGDAVNYELGDHVTFRTSSQVYGLQAGARARVVGVDPERNEVRVKLERGGFVAFNTRRLRGTDVGRVQERRFAVGDRLEFREPDQRRGIANGSLGTVESINRTSGQARVRLDRGDLVTVDLKRPQAIEYGYASTSLRSQARTVDHSIVVAEARHITPEVLYVGTSRVREGTVVLTDDRATLFRSLGRERESDRALDVARAAQRQESLIGAAQQELAGVEKRLRSALTSGKAAAYDAARAERYEIEQRTRGDLDQVQHHDLMHRRAQLVHQVETAPTSERRALRQQHVGVVDQLYGLRHGQRSQLGGFTGRLTMQDEARLHAAHQALNKRAEDLDAAALRSPLTRADLAGRSAEELRAIADKAEALTRRPGPGIPAGVVRHELEDGVRELGELARGEREIGRDGRTERSWDIER